MKHLMVALLIGAAMFGIGCQAQPESHPKDAAGNTIVQTKATTVETVSPAEAGKLMSSNAEMQVLDVRTPEEVAMGVIKGAKTINWFDADFGAQADASLDKTKPILVYCKAGSRSAQAADVLLKKGFSKVYNLQGGMMKWEGEGHPVQK